MVEGGFTIGPPRSLHAYRSLSYARTRVRVRFTVVEEGSLLLIEDALWLKRDPQWPMEESLLLKEDAQGSPRSLHAYRIVSYARTRARVRQTAISM